MATRGTEHGRPRASPGAPTAGAVARLQVVPGHWAEGIPPVPDGFVVTVSFGTPADAEEHAEALGLLGYVHVQAPVAGPGSGEPVAWMLVSGDLARAHPAWWEEVRGSADRVYALAMGPVQRLLAPLLTAHLTGAGASS